MRNPNWQRDELILALDLYFKLENRGIDRANPKIIELSNLLNKLPIHNGYKQQQSFRNPSGVAMKLSNFKRFDPDYTGKGLERGGKLEEIIWEEFSNQRKMLHEIARIIKDISESNEVEELLNIDESNYEACEGKVLMRTHICRERNSTLTKKKKNWALKKYGRLACEICAFDFNTFYGLLGDGFIECHHIQPLSELKADEKTKLEDLVLVCANCHRMLHRNGNRSVEELKFVVGGV